MNQRLAAAVISMALTISACARTEIHSRLVGTWEEVADAAIVKPTETKARDNGATQSTNRATAASDESAMRFVFASDGTTHMSAPMFTHLYERTDRWILVDESANSTSIDMISQGPQHADEKTRLTFVFEDPDFIREVGGQMDGTKYRRVK